jgi:tetratricopeptide (TPR) repeat protein
MKYLLATNQLFSFTGSELTIRTLANVLLSHGNDVLIYSPFVKLGSITNGLKITSDLGTVKEYSPDACYTQHNTVFTCIRATLPKSPIAHALLGVLPHLEKLPKHHEAANYLLPISEEVANEVSRSGVNTNKISIFRNIVDDKLFSSHHAIDKIERIVTFSYKLSSEKFNSIETVCANLALDLVDHQPSFAGSIHYESVPGVMLSGDIVITSGRGAIEAMLCGRIPLIMADCGDDGLVTPENFFDLMKCNFSGRATGRTFNQSDISREILRARPEYGEKLNDLARRNLGTTSRSSEVVDFFLSLAKETAPVISKNLQDEIAFDCTSLDLHKQFATISSSAGIRAVEPTDVSISNITSRLNRIKNLIQSAKPDSAKHAASAVGNIKNDSVLISKHQERVSEARTLTSSGKHESAINILISLASEDSPIPDVFSDLANLAVINGDRKAAIDLFEVAITKEPSLGDTALRLAELYNEEGDPLKAIASISQHLRMRPNDFRAINILRASLEISKTLPPIIWARLLADLRYQSASLSGELIEKSRIIDEIEIITNGIN